MTVKIGINPLTWTNDDLPSLGAETPLEVCLSEGKIAGFEGFELGNKFPRVAEILGPILKKYQLELVSGWYSMNLLERTVEEEIEAVQPHLTLLKSLGAKVMVVCETTHAIHTDRQTPVYLRRSIFQENHELFITRINAFADYLQNEGVNMTYHHHMGTLIQTQSEVDWLMQNTHASVGLLLDTGHLTFAGENPLDVANKWISRINHVHCKDIRKEVLERVLNQRESFLEAVLKGVFTVPGDGCIDYASILTLLASHRYQGWLVVEAEQDPSVAHPLTYAKLGFQNLSRFAKESGLRLSL